MVIRKNQDQRVLQIMCLCCMKAYPRSVYPVHATVITVKHVKNMTKNKMKDDVYFQSYGKVNLQSRMTLWNIM